MTLRSRALLLVLVPSALVALATLVVACVGDDPAQASDGATGDGGSEGGRPGDGAVADQAASGDAQDVDAADAAKVCSPLAAFDAPELLGGVNNPGIAVNGARLSPEEQTLYYGRRSPPSATPAFIDELFFATRNSTNVSFGTSSPLLSDVNYEKRAANPTLLANQTTMFFNTTGFVAGSTHVAVASRGNAATNFTTAGDLTFVAGPSDSDDPYANADGSRLYFRSGGGIFVAAKQGTSYGDIVQVVPAAAGATYAHPVLSADELTMWLTKADTTNTYNVYVTQRKKLDVAFDVPVPFPSVEGAGPASPTWLSPDGCRMYLTVAFKMPPVVDTGTLVETHVFRASRTPK